MEVAINSAQKIQMDSLRRQLEVRCITAEPGCIRGVTEAVVPGLPLRSGLRPGGHAELHAVCPKC